MNIITHSVSPLPFQVDSPSTAWVSIGTGRYHTCAARLDNGLAECWGNNGNNEGTPPANTAFSGISGGYDFTCGIEAGTGFPVCFGDNNSNKVSGTPTSTPLASVSTGCAFDLCHIHNPYTRLTCHTHSHYAKYSVSRLRYCCIGPFHQVLGLERILPIHYT